MPTIAVDHLTPGALLAALELAGEVGDVDAVYKLGWELSLRVFEGEIDNPAQVAGLRSKYGPWFCGILDSVAERQQRELDRNRVLEERDELGLNDLIRPSSEVDTDVVTPGIVDTSVADAGVLDYWWDDAEDADWWDDADLSDWWDDAGESGFDDVGRI